MMSRKQTGSVEAFSANWKERPESNRYHFHRGAAQNQIQFAFQNHWRIFRKVMGEVQSGRALEVGCGRGSMSAFFAESGFETHLLDTSFDALKIAEINFEEDGLNGEYLCGNALGLPYSSESFDVVVSIGLFEHFADIAQPLREQMRILKPGGIFLGYIVPGRLISVQTLALPVNIILWFGHKIFCALTPGNGTTKAPSKAPLYRNDYPSSYYLRILEGMGVESFGSFGMFPLPLISHSPSFPFTLMHPYFERVLVRLWQIVLKLRQIFQQDPWICSEHWGLAVLVWVRKAVIS